jgi:hypothetical protein
LAVGYYCFIGGHGAFVGGAISVVAGVVVSVVVAAGVGSRSFVADINSGRRVATSGGVVSGGVAAVGTVGSAGATCGVFALTRASWRPVVATLTSGHEDVADRAAGGVAIGIVVPVGASSQPTIARGGSGQRVAHGGAYGGDKLK